MSGSLDFETCFERKKPSQPYTLEYVIQFYFVIKTLLGKNFAL